MALEVDNFMRYINLLTYLLTMSIAKGEYRPPTKSTSPENVSEVITTVTPTDAPNLVQIRPSRMASGQMGEILNCVTYSTAVFKETSLIITTCHV